MGRQLRHPDPDLRDAGLGPEHRGRPGRPARPRLCRVLRGRRLFLRAAGDDVRPVLLDLPAARRHARRVLGHHSRLSRVAPARRLSRHRHARLRRNHPHGARQLGRLHRRRRRHRLDSEDHLLRPALRRSTRRLRRLFPPRLFAAARQDVPLLRHPLPRADHQPRLHAIAPAAHRARLGGAARRRDRLPLARHQHHQHQADRLRAGRLLRRIGRFLLRRAAGLHQPRELHLRRVGDDSRHRRARRNGLADRRRVGGGVPDRRIRTAARTRFSPRRHVERDGRVLDMPRRDRVRESSDRAGSPRRSRSSWSAPSSPCGRFTCCPTRYSTCSPCPVSIPRNIAACCSASRWW